MFFSLKKKTWVSLGNFKNCRVGTHVFFFEKNMGYGSGVTSDPRTHSHVFGEILKFIKF